MPITSILVAAGGALLALPYIAWARTRRDWKTVFAAGLVIAALIYAGFAAAAGEWRAVAVEVGGVLLFGALAAIGARWSPLILAAGWIAHIGWDLLLHPIEASGYAPWWYPVLCIGFDGAVGVFIAVKGRANIRPA